MTKPTTPLPVRRYYAHMQYIGVEMCQGDSELVLASDYEASEAERIRLKHLSDAQAERIAELTANPYPFDKEIGLAAKRVIEVGLAIPYATLHNDIIKVMTQFGILSHPAAIQHRRAEDAGAELAKVKSAADALLTGTINGYDQQMDNLAKNQISLLQALESSLKEVK